MNYRIRIAALAMATACAATALAQNSITVTVNGSPVQFDRQGPMMNGDRVFVPLRGVFQSMGAHVDWDPSSQTVRAERGDTHVKLTIGQGTAAVNGQPTELDTPAQIVGGSTMVPLRFVGEALGGTVDWSSESQTVAIQIGDYNLPPARVRRDHPHFDPHPAPVVEQMPPVIQVNTVLQASFNLDLDARKNHRGDVVEATVNDRANGLPPGSRVRGVVDSAQPRVGNRPGKLSVRFTSLILPGGKSVPISGEMTASGKAGGTAAHGEHIATGTKIGIRLKSNVRLHK